MVGLGLSLTALIASLIIFCYFRYGVQNILFFEIIFEIILTKNVEICETTEPEFTKTFSLQLLFKWLYD